MKTPLVEIIPGMGWDTGVNLNICDVNITLAQADDEDFVYGPKYKATMDTLIVMVRKISGHRHFVGFLPEEGIFVLVPDWIYREAS